MPPRNPLDVHPAVEGGAGVAAEVEPELSERAEQPRELASDLETKR